MVHDGRGPCGLAVDATLSATLFDLKLFSQSPASRTLCLLDAAETELACRSQASGIVLTTPEEQSQISAIIDERTRDLPPEDLDVLNFWSWSEALRHGVAAHHAGMLPVFKETVEVLFTAGLVKVVFATETMSLGIHMPARSVVLQSLTKRTERGFRSLSHNELTQMAGRAGRRGIDTEGKCVIALDARDGVEGVVRVVDGSPEPIESQFKLGYGSVAMLMATGAPPEALRRRVEASFGQYQNLKRMREMEAQVQRLEALAAEARAFAAPCGDFGRIGRYRRLRQRSTRTRTVGR